MLLTLAGCAEHEEDGWDGRLLQIGAAVVRVGGPVPRCAVTTRDPDTGVRDLDTLRLIQGYRGVRGLIEQPTHLSIAVRCSMAVIDARALIVTRTDADP